MIVLLLIAACASPQPPKTANPPQPEGTGTHKPSGDQGSVTPLTVEVKGPVITKRDTAEQKADADREQSRDTANYLFSGLLVLVGAGQVWMMGRQAGITGKQNDILKRQSDLMNRQAIISDGQLKLNQRALMASSQQWLETTNWDARVIRRKDGGGIVMIHFDIRNPGKTLVVRLLRVQTQLLEGSDVDHGGLSPDGEILPPEHERSFHSPVYQLTNLELAIKNRLSVSVIVTADYMDGMERKRRQRFGCRCSGGLGGFKYIKFDGNIIQDDPGQEH